MTPSTALRHARRRAGLSQRQLAHATGVPQSTVGRIEAGLSDPRTRTLQALLRACGEDLEVVPRRGMGLDRSAIRRNLALSPRERLERASQAGRAIERVRSATPVATP